MPDSSKDVMVGNEKKLSWGPDLIACGFLMLIPIFLFISASSSPTIYHYICIGIPILVIIAGIGIMFFQLIAKDESLSKSVKSDDKSTVLEQTVIQLSKNYEVLRRQTIQGFLLTGTFMASGLLVILSGSLGDLFGWTKEGSNLTTIAGIIMEFISGTSLVIYRINFKRLNETSNKLESTWRVLTAYRLTDTLPEEKKAEATMKLIDALISNDKIVPDNK